MTLEETYQLGYVIKTHGLKGHVTAQFDADNAQAYKKLKTIYLALKATPTALVAYPVESLQIQPGEKGILLKLRGIDRIEEAEPLRHASLFLPLQELPKLKADQFYFHDVIGFTVVDAAAGALGTVENFFELPQQDVLAMRYEGQEVLIPVAGDIVTHADAATRQVFVNLPDGLLDVYLKPSTRAQDEAEETDKA